MHQVGVADAGVAEVVHRRGKQRSELGVAPQADPGRVSSQPLALDLC